MSRPQTLRRPRRGWRIARRVFRWCRITVWLILLSVLVAVVWLNQRGVPDVLKERVLAALRERGLEMQFSRMRVGWYTGIIAEDLVLSRVGEPQGLRLWADEAVLLPDFEAWRTLNFELQSVAVRGGSLVVPAALTNRLPRQLEITNIAAELRFRPGDEWELASFEARSLGVRWRMSGNLRHPLELGRFKEPRSPTAPTVSEYWHRVLGELQQVRLGTDAEITAHFTGDGRDRRTLRARVDAITSGFQSPWANGSNFVLSADLRPHSNDLVRAKVRFGAERVHTEWFDARRVNLQTDIAPSFDRFTPTNGHLTAALTGLRTRWGRAADFRLAVRVFPAVTNAAFAWTDVQATVGGLQTPWLRTREAGGDFIWQHSATNFWPQSLTASLRLRDANSPSVAAGPLGRLRAQTAQFDLATQLPAMDVWRWGDTNVAWSQRLELTPFTLRGAVTNLAITNQELRTVQLALDWRAPNLAVRRLDAELYDGALQATGRLDTATRELALSASTSFEPAHVIPFLDAGTREFLSRVSWRTPPHVEAHARVTLPPWTNFAAGLKPTLATNLWVAGRFAATNVSYGRVPALTANSQVSFSNFVWTLPDLHVTQTGGELDLFLASNDRTHRYHLRGRSRTEVQAFLPLVKRDNARAVLDLFTWTNAPVVEAELWGNWQQPAELRLNARLALTNFTFRGETLNEFTTTLAYTNGGLAATDTRVARAEGEANVPWLWVDIPKARLHLSNAVSTLDPDPVARAIGSNVVRALAPYRFARPPHALVNGSVDLTARGDRQNLRFDVQGGPLTWKVFHPDAVTAEVHWNAQTLTLSNVTGRLRGGAFTAGARFWFLPDRSADFRFGFDVTNLDLQTFMKDISIATNHVEGTLTAQVLVTNANTDRLTGWFGAGRMSLTNGLIWDLPIFALFSPMLNALHAGLGNNRAREAHASFIITNSVIATTDLALHTGQARMQFEGTLDFETRVEGSMEAQMFRDTKGIGSLLSTVLWPVQKLFAYKISGTLEAPKRRPLHMPARILMAPLRPFQTLQELFGSDSAPGKKP